MKEGRKEEGEVHILSLLLHTVLFSFSSSLLFRTQVLRSSPATMVAMGRVYALLVLCVALLANVAPTSSSEVHDS